MNNKGGKSEQEGMNSHAPHLSTLQVLLQNITVALLYLTTGRLGLYLAIPPGYATVVWAPSGIALGAVLTTGMHVLPGIGLGSFAVNLWITFSNSNVDNFWQAIFLCGAIASGAVLQAFFGGLLIQKLVGRSLDLARTKDVVKFFFLAGPVGCLVNATVSVTALVLFGAINASQFLHSWITWWGGDTLGVLIITPIILVFLGQPRVLWGRRMKMVAAPLIGAVLLAIVAFQQTMSSDRSKLRAGFDVEAELMVEDLKKGMDGYEQALVTLNAFYTAQSGNVSISEFKHFVQGILPNYPGIQAISWNPLVKHDRRKAFEHRAKTESHSDFEISELSPDGRMISAAKREEYIVVHYIEPLEANKLLVGFDISSDPIRRLAIDRATISKTIVATGLIRLVQDNGDKKGFLILYPVFSQTAESGKHRSSKILGYFVAAIRIDDMVNAILGNQFKAGKVALRIEDNNGVVLFDHGVRLRDRFSDFIQTRPLQGVEGINWKLSLEPTPSYLDGIAKNQAWFVLVGGFLFASLVGGFFLILSAQNELLTAEIAKSTLNQTIYRESEARKKEIIEASLDSIISIDGSGRIIEFNRSAEATFQCKRDDVMGKSMADIIIPPRFRQAHHAGLKRYLATGVGPILGKRIEMVAQRSDGSEFPVDISIVALKEQGQPVFTAFLRDITDAKDALTKLQLLSNASKLLGASLDYDTTLSAAVKLAVPKFAEWSAADLLIEGDIKNVAVAHIDPSKIELAKLLRQQYPVSMNDPYGLANVLRTGKSELLSDIPDELLVATTHDSKHLQIARELSLKSAIIVPMEARGEIIGALSFITGSTGRKYNEHDLKFAEELAARAALAIDNSRLFQKSQEASVSKSAFLANMSHEIRTPLGVILGFSELLANPESTSSEKLNFIGAIKRNGELLANIINDILDLSKVEAGKLQTERLETAISEIITDISSFLRLKAVEKGIELSISYEKTVPKIIRTDPLRLKQILMNIVGNAIKFTECGSVDVTLKFLQKNDESGNLVFVVKDTGRGISKEEKKKLFQPFSQADVTTKRKFGGTGLGLVLSKHLAVLLGGDVVLTESTPQKGSTFTITIDSGPILKSSISEMGEERKILLSSNDGSEVRLDGIRVLVVDDSADNQILVSKFLKMAGAQVNTAENGEVALEKIRQEKYDIVLMDLQMPIKDGYETTAQLRREGYKTPIFALTAHALKEERQHC